MRNIKGIAQRLLTQLTNRQIGISSERARVLSYLSQRTARFKEHQRQTRKSLARLCGVVPKDRGDAGQLVEMQSAKAVGPTSMRAARWFREKLVWLPFYPVRVAKRPMPIAEDPRIAKKVEEARLWMKEHGIGDELPKGRVPLSSRRVPPKAALRPQEADEALAPRRPPRAVGQPPSSPAKSAGES